MKIFIGLMGIDNDGMTLISPSNKKLFKVPRFLARKIQKIQHRIAMLTWN